MVEGLPPDGALARRLAGHHWQHRDFMLADLVDEIARLRVDFGNANRPEKTAANSYRDPVWRPEKPGAKKKRAKKARQETAAARSGYLRIVAQVTPEYAEKG